jgi:hypothetical protein
MIYHSWACLYIFEHTYFQGAKMPDSTPIARTKTAALCRVLDSIPKGYYRYTTGTVAPEKAERVILKLHKRHAIGITPSKRMTRRSKGKASALLVVYWPENATVVSWLMLFTAGELDFYEKLRDVTDKPHMAWLGYELIRYSNRGKPSWTWKRPKEEMTEHYMLLSAALKKRQNNVVTDHLSRIARQPGFHGVREQSKMLCKYAQQGGYSELLPKLFYVEKVSHGEQFVLS